MKNLSLILSGAALATLALLSTAAGGAQPAQEQSFRAGATIFGLNLVAGTANPLAGSSTNTPISVREIKGDWIRIDFPNMKTSPTWVSINNIISFRKNR
ncbi:MAG: hypothetical protein ABGY71_06920 [bacterium]|jgi:hypothetical protein